MNADKSLAVMCPSLFAGKKAFQSILAARKQREEDVAVGGGGGGGVYGTANNAMGFSLDLFLFLLIPIGIIGGLWLYPMIKAFRCSQQPLHGLLWGLLIFFIPPLGLIYLFVGCHPDQAAETAAAAVGAS